MTRTRARTPMRWSPPPTRHGVRLAVVSQHRYRGAPMAARALIDAGRIGTIRMIRIFGPNAGWDIPATAWASDRSQVSPYMDWGAHACDIVRWLTGVEATLGLCPVRDLHGHPARRPELDGALHPRRRDPRDDLAHVRAAAAAASARRCRCSSPAPTGSSSSTRTARCASPPRTVAGRRPSSSLPSTRSTPTIRSGCRPTPRSWATSSTPSGPVATRRSAVDRVPPRPRGSRRPSGPPRPARPWPSMSRRCDPGRPTHAT